MNRRVVAIWVVMALMTIALAIVLYRGKDGLDEFARTPEAIPMAEDGVIAPSLLPSSLESPTIGLDEVVRSAIVAENPTPVDQRPSAVIRVVDEAGAPIPDSPVAWGLATSGGLPPYRASTDARGEIELDATELDALFERNEETPLRVASLEVWVEASDDASRAERARQEAEEKGIEIRIPAPARIVVEVFEAEAPLWESVVVELFGSENGPDDCVLLDREIAGFGRCEFSRIRPNLHYFARTSFAGLEETSAYDFVRLSKSGFNPPIQIRFPALARIHFGVIDASGEPLRDAVVSIARRGIGPGTPRPVDLRLDRHGRGLVSWPASTHPFSVPRFIDVSMMIGDRKNSASLSLPDPLLQGTLELGYAQLCPVPIPIETPAGSDHRR